MKSQGNDPRFPVFIADEGLNFKKHVFDDPKVLGRQLIEAADEALKYAKQHGKAQVVEYSSL